MFDVLRYLLEHRDRLVTKDELLDAVWKDTFVTPNVLTRAVAQVRKSIGDDAFEAKYIETVAKRGYRFIAPLDASSDVASAVSSVPVQAAVSSPPRSLSLAFAGIIAILLTVIAGLATVAFRGRTPADAPATSSTGSLRRFSIGSHSYSFPSISPDGSKVAYSSDQTGGMEIYTAGLAQGSTEAALTTDGGHNTDAEWSSDGQWIAYRSRKKGGIWIVPSGGGTARRVVDFGSQPSWTPDGKHIVFTSSAGGMAAQSILWSVDREGGEPRQVTRLGAPRGGHSQPAVSPDGRLVVFAVSHGFINSEIWTASMDGGPVEKLGIGKVPRFSPEGDAIYWIGPTTVADNDTLMRVEIDNRGAATGEPRMIQSFPGNFAGGFAIARDRSAVVWLYQASANLWSVDVPSVNVAPPAPQALTFDDVHNSYPSHSSDGRIAFHQLAAGQPPTSWMISEDGKNRELLTVGLKLGVWGPQWTPDNRHLFVATGSPPDTKEESRGTKPAFAWLNLATRQLSAIGPADGALNPRLSPDGRQIAFHVIDQGGVLNVWTRSVDGGPRKQVTFDAEAMSYPMWSPDGKTLVVEIKRGDYTHIGLVSNDGGPVEPLVAEPGQNWPHSWAPDNDHIAFAGSRDGVWNIYTVSRKTKQIRRLTDFTSVDGYVRYPSWSRTRPTIVFVRAEQRGSLWTAKLP